MSLDPLRLLPAATRLATRVPEPVVDRAVQAVGTIVGALPSARNRRVAAHTARLRPDLDPRQLRRAVRANSRGYLRYFAEAVTLGRVTDDQLLARFRTVGRENIQPTLDAGRPVVTALLHAGNWDLAGAWSCLDLAPVLTVAERLRPDSLHEQFLRLRTDLGMTIVVAEPGRPVLPELVARAPGHPFLVPLLADRDLGHSGVEVEVAGHRMLVAAGPAALALAIDAPLIISTLRHERLTGERARRAGSRWGVVADFSAPLTAGRWAPGTTRPDDVAPRAVDRVATARPEGAAPHRIDGDAGTGTAVRPQERPDLPADRAGVVALTRAWVARAEPFLVRHPEQWHMLQPVFTEDLDPVRLAAGRARATQRETR